MVSEPTNTNNKWGGKRKGSGRPSFLTEPKTFYVRLDGDTATHIQNIASENNQKVSEVIREAIKSYLPQK